MSWDLRRGSPFSTICFHFSWPLHRGSQQFFYLLFSLMSSKPQLGKMGCVTSGSLLNTAKAVEGGLLLCGPTQSSPEALMASTGLVPSASVHCLVCGSVVCACALVCTGEVVSCSWMINRPLPTLCPPCSHPALPSSASISHSSAATFS